MRTLGRTHMEWQQRCFSFSNMGGNTNVTVMKRARALTRWLELAQDDPAALDGLAKDLGALPACDASASAIADLLDDRRVAWMRDSAGRNLRALAVAALMRMGYPWALGVEPQDLSLLRCEQRASDAPVLRWMNALLAMGPFVVAATVLAGVVLFSANALVASTLLIALCSSATAAAVWIGAFSEKRREGFRAAAGVAILAAIIEWAWGIAVGGLDLMMVGSVPVVLCALMSMTTSLVTPAPLDA
jgi:hypothetical protein